jgi:hypothetical protein
MIGILIIPIFLLDLVEFPSGMFGEESRDVVLLVELECGTGVDAEEGFLIDSKNSRNV